MSPGTGREAPSARGGRSRLPPVSRVARPAESPVPPITREQRLVTAGLMAALAVAALDVTVVGTAMPTIIGQLGGLGEYAWVFSAYLLTSTTTVPLYARLADIHGRKPVFLFALALFVIGSALCGLSGSMVALIAFRTLQGLGAGGMQPIAFTIVADIFEPRQRARMQGYFSSIWGISAIVGPALGGLITSTVGWPWVFELNIPVGIVAWILVWSTFRERFERRPHRVDWTGAGLLSGSIVLLLLAVSEVADLFGWASLPVVTMLAASALLAGSFVRRSRRLDEPLIDLRLFSVPLIRVGVSLGAIAGIVMFGVTTYVPPLVQGVQGGTAIEAGAVVAAMSVGWPVGSIVSGRSLARFGARPLVVAGTAALAVGALALTQQRAVGEIWFSTAACAVVGLGMGTTWTALMVVIQGAVEWRRRATVTGVVQFSRTIGGSVGVGVMGGILTAFVGGASSAILDPVARSGLTPAELAAGRQALAAGLDVTYAIMAVAAIATWALAVRSMPAVDLDHRFEPASAPMARD
jgi:EmrB/QacA subfamily drug resistance transporter